MYANSLYSAERRFTNMTKVTSLNCDFRIECAILHSFGKACRREGTTGRTYG